MGRATAPIFFMLIIVTAPTIAGGVDYQPDHRPQRVPDNIGRHLVEIGNATPFETKVVQATEKKKPEKDIICLATGPSLTKEDCEKARESGKELIVINDNYRMIPDADVLYACDQRWWEYHIPNIQKTFTGEKVMKVRDDRERKFCSDHGITPIRGTDGRGVGRDCLHFGSNSGYQAMNLAYLRGATRIILLGYDMQVNGKAHWFGSHPKENGMTDGAYSSYVPRFDSIAVDLTSEGVQVVNCTRETALHQFPRAKLEDVL